MGTLEVSTYVDLSDEIFERIKATPPEVLVRLGIALRLIQLSDLDEFAHLGGVVCTDCADAGPTSVHTNRARSAAAVRGGYTTPALVRDGAAEVLHATLTDNLLEQLPDGCEVGYVLHDALVAYGYGICPLDEPHVAEVSDDFWFLEHSLRCRQQVGISACPIHEAMRQVQGPAVGPGRWLVTLDVEGRLHFEPEVP